MSLRYRVFMEISGFIEMHNLFHNECGTKIDGSNFGFPNVKLELFDLYFEPENEFYGYYGCYFETNDEIPLKLISNLCDKYNFFISMEWGSEDYSVYGKGLVSSAYAKVNDNPDGIAHNAVAASKLWELTPQTI